MSRILDILPLSFAQENLLFHAVTNQDRPDPYVVQARFEIDPPVDAEAVPAALAALLDRHKNLRACFRHEKLDQPVQVIPTHAEVPLTTLDWSGYGGDALAARRVELQTEDRQPRFDLTRPPLIRGTLVRHDAGGDLLLTLHHILLDGWSMPILARELAALYRAGSDQKVAALPPPPPYRRYLAWLWRRDRGPAEAAWREALGGLPHPARLPAPVPGQPRELAVALPADLSAALARRAEAAGVTLNTLTQVAWALVLAGVTGADEVVFGAVVSGRPPELPGMEVMVGQFANVLPVRIRLRARESAAALLARVQDEQLRLAEHHHVRLADVQRAAGVGPLFDTILAFENFPRDEEPGGGLRLVETRDGSQSRLALVAMAGERLMLRLIGRGDVDLQAIVDALRRALAALAGDPEVPVGNIDVLPQAERDRLPAPGSGTDAGRAAPPDPAPAASGSAREQELCALFAAVLGVPDAGPEDSFFALGGHSLLALRLVARIESTLGIHVPVGTLFEAPSPAALAARIEAPQEPAGRTAGFGSLDPLITLRAGGDRTPLFCLHSALGLGWVYSTLVPHLAPDRPVYALQAASLSGGTPLPESLEGLAEEYVRRMRAVQPEGPYLLAGYSFGGLLIYQMAVLLRRAGQEVGLVAVLDTHPMPAGADSEPVDREEVDQDTMRILLRRGVPGAPAPSGSLDRDQVFATVRGAGGLFAGYRDQDLAAILDGRAYHIRLALDWHPPRYDGRLTLFSATAQPGGLSTADKVAAWDTAAGVDVYELACAHSHLLEPGSAEQIAAIIETRLQETAAAPDEEYEFPVSPAQGRLLVADGLHPGSAQYNVPVAFAVQGWFDAAAFGRALDALTARHESLRTTFRAGKGSEPVQVVAATARADLRIEPEVDAGEVEARLRAEAARPFDTETGPLLRATVYPVAGGGHRILLSAHHLVCDAWSLEIMLRELAAAYRADLDGVAYHPDALPIQYPDYAAWQAERRDRGEYAESIAHWAEQLRGAPETIALPTDRPRPAVRSAAGGTVGFTLPAATRARLAEVARSRGGTQFMALFSAYAAFLARLSGQDDLVVGVPVAGRDRPELHGMVGMLTNTLALRADLSGSPTLHDLIDRTRTQLLAGAPHQDAPFDAVVDAVAGAREPSQEPLVQAMFGYDDETELALPLPDARVERVEMVLDAAKFDLVLYVERRGEELLARLIYRADLFDHDTVARWAENFQTLLAGLLADPDAPVDTVELVSAEERQRVLAGADRTGEAAPETSLVPELIAARAAAQPEATALVCGEQRLSYRELMGRADRLARRLREAGVAPEVPVGLLLPRGLEMPLAMLSVLRAGGAFVPLDPDDPPARLAHLVGDAGLRVLVASDATAAIAATLGVPVLPVADSDPDPPGPPPGPAPHPKQLAYLLYTSGSTGVPKSVAVEHRALANLVVGMAPQLELGAGDRLLQFFAFTFDVAVADTFLSWVAGAELHVAQEHERLGTALADRLASSRITHVIMAPAAAMLLPQPEALAAMRTWTVGGEAVPAELVDRLAAPGRRVVNAYGPTEAAVLSTATDVRPGEPVVIGPPVPGARTYVLDRRLRVVPVGVTGEIYVAGVPLGRGYQGRPSMTAERFVADPFADACGANQEPGGRMYRTGDLGRYDAQGRLHYLGRADTQVKVRGFRIELGEVETVLATHPGVAVAAAAAHGTGVDRRLVAYVVGAGGARPADHELRAHLAARLPGYLMPEVFVHLEELPVNRSGKVDRSRLPDPPPDRPVLSRPYVPAATATQQRVAEIWAEVLGHGEIGVDDNFFELGGNSVRLLTVLAALRDGAGGADLELADLFRYPTVATLADHLDKGDQPAPSQRGGDRRARLAAATQARQSKRGDPR